MTEYLTLLVAPFGLLAAAVITHFFNQRDEREIALAVAERNANLAKRSDVASQDVQIIKNDWAFAPNSALEAPVLPGERWSDILKRELFLDRLYNLSSRTEQIYHPAIVAFKLRRSVIEPAPTSTAGQNLDVAAPKLEPHTEVPDNVLVPDESVAAAVKPHPKAKRARAFWGTSRARVDNLIGGTTAGFEKKLEINGVGYRAAVSGRVLKLSLGYSHDIDYAIPKGVAIVTPKPTEIVITGIDKQIVGQIAAEIREYRGPEPYKGKAVRYAGEFISSKSRKKK